MHMPSAAGLTIEWPDGPHKHLLPRLDIQGELDFQAAHEEYALSRLPRPGHPARAEMLAAHMAELSSNEFAFGGPLSVRFLNTPYGQALYLSFLCHRGHRDSQGASAAPPAPRDLLARQKAGDAALAELWLRVVRRDFPTPGPDDSPSGPTAAAGGPSTPG
jgi:hypothetical protein